MAKGWVKLHREVTSHWLFEEQRVFSKFEAWTDLLLMVNHQDKKLVIDGELVAIERGSTITSLRTLCQRWKWSNTKTVKFLEILENDSMILKKSDTKKTVITLMNYEKYQGDDDEKTTDKRHEDDTETTRKHTNKNVKNEKNVKNDEPKIAYAENVRLSETEYQRLVTEYGKELTDLSVNYLSLYKLEKAYKTKDDNLTIRRWVIDATRKAGNVLPFKQYEKKEKEVEPYFRPSS